MLKIFKYKKLYYDICVDFANNSLELDCAKSEIQELEDKLEKERKNFEILQKKKEEEYLTLRENLTKKLEITEKRRRKNSGRLGGMQYCINKLKREKTEMLEVMNRLIAENQDLKNEKKKAKKENLRKKYRKY